ncbi:sodium-dependent multivitamin transporter-like isoform X2 [Ptychodera flava]|uniref:sodium-dependent multivitamin transporter-like isoform X2 n=1 Tax=Ptychodera flava TaxID=63121 RepID=UPI00396A0719
MSTDAVPFGALDYFIFGLVLAVPVAMGMYQAFAKGGQHTTSRYLVADRTMRALPVAMSFLVSFMSPITILGSPAEVYANGYMYSLGILSAFWAFPFFSAVLVPVFYGLKLNSSYEYLSLRFNYWLRVLASGLFILRQGMYIAFCLLGPALAFEAVQKFEMWKTTVILGVVCTFYTAIGGIKAVIWADVFQFLVIYGSILAIVVMGCLEVGSLDSVWQYNVEHGRLATSFSLDPTTRLTFQNVIVGIGMNTLSIYVSQTAVQRIIATKTLKQAQLSVLLNIPFECLILSMVYLTGLVLFAFYNDQASPLMPAINATLPSEFPEFGGNVKSRYTPKYNSPDQILVFFVSSQFGDIPGMQGLFMACVTAGSLSSISSSINAITAATLQDFVKPFRGWRARVGGHSVRENDKRDTLLSKCLAFVYGSCGIGLTFVAASMGTYVRMANLVIGIVAGPVTGLFLTGMLYRRANGKGMLIGLLIGFSIGIWISVGGVVYKKEIDSVSAVYRLSFMWFSSMTCLTTMVVGIICSEVVRLISPEEKRKVVDPMLLATFLSFPTNKHV